MESICHRSAYFFVLSDNYETSVLFLMIGNQILASGFAYNIGYEFRAASFRNYWFMFFALCFTFIHVYITLVPRHVSCFFRINCTNDYVNRGLTVADEFPVNNPFNTTVMPLSFRWKMVAIGAGNIIAVVLYDNFIINRI